MKILGTAAALSGTTQFTSSTAVWVANTATTHKTVTLRNVDDDANLGTLVVPASSGVVVHLEPGQGLRGDAALTGTQVDANSGR